MMTNQTDEPQCLGCHKPLAQWGGGCAFCDRICRHCGKPFWEHEALDSRAICPNSIFEEDEDA